MTPHQSFAARPVMYFLFPRFRELASLHESSSLRSEASHDVVRGVFGFLLKLQHMSSRAVLTRIAILVLRSALHYESALPQRVC